MSYNEKNLTANFSRYLKLHPTLLSNSAAIEFKVIKGHTCNFKSHVRPHQIPSLLKAKHLSIYHKISDLGCMLAPSPFDSFYLTKADAFLAILYFKTRKPKILYFISINTVLSFQLIKNKITEADAKTYCDFSITL